MRSPLFLLIIALLFSACRETATVSRSDPGDTGFLPTAAYRSVTVDDVHLRVGVAFDADGDGAVSSNDLRADLLAARSDARRMNAFTTLEAAGVPLAELNRRFGLQLSRSDIDQATLRHNPAYFRAHLYALGLINTLLADDAAGTPQSRLSTLRAATPRVLDTIMQGWEVTITQPQPWLSLFPLSDAQETQLAQILDEVRASFRLPVTRPQLLPTPQIATQSDDNRTWRVTLTQGENHPIYYTTDGAAVTLDAALYAGTFTVEGGTVVRAAAIYKGMDSTEEVETVGTAAVSSVSSLSSSSTVSSPFSSAVSSPFSSAVSSTAVSSNAPAPVNCVGTFVELSDWGECSESCGGGIQSRDSYYYVVVPAQNGGTACPYTHGYILTETQPCNTHGCDPVDCNGSFVYGDWSVCSVDCGGGEQSRPRTYTVLDPAEPGGEACPYEDGYVEYESRECGVEPCHTFLDVGMRECLLDTLGHPDADLTSADLPQLRALGTLECTTPGTDLRRNATPIATLGDLEALEMFALTSFSAGFNAITSVLPLQPMTQMQTLLLSNNALGDVSALQPLTQLVNLDLSYNDLNDLTGFPDLPQLTYLDLSSTGIETLDPLAPLTALQRLYLSSNLIIDVTPLQSLTGLNDLDVRNNRICDLSPIAFVASALTDGQDRGACYAAVIFDDPNLDAAVREAVGRVDDLPLYTNDVDTLQSLNATDRSITTLGGIRYLAALRTLNLADNALTAITELGQLTLLEDLNLSRNDLKDANLSELVTLTALRTLDLSDNRRLQDTEPISGIGNIEPIGTLSALTALFLGGNSIIDLTPLASLEALIRLDLADQKAYNLYFPDSVTTLTSITPLATLAKLQWLDLSDNHISDLDPLNTLTQLQHLKLGTNAVSDVTALSTLPLVMLDLGDNALTDIAALQNIQTLQHIDVSDNRICDLSPIDFVPDKVTGGQDTSACLVEVTFPDPYLDRAVRDTLGRPAQDTQPIYLHEVNGWTTFDAVERYISSLEGIGALASLQTLNLDYNNVADLSPLASLSDLKALHLDGNGVSDVSALQSLGALQTLDLSSNAIDLDQLKSLTSLVRLELRSNSLSDVTALHALPNLRELDLSSNPDIPLEQITAMPNLTALELRYNSLKDVAGLQNLTALVTLDLGGNDGIGPAELATLTPLVTLGLSNNNITDLDGIQPLSALRTLYLSGNAITDLTPLSGLTALQTLTLDFNPITAFPSLNLPSLQTLSLYQTGLADLAGLATLTTLVELNLYLNDVSDLTPIRQLPRLETVNLGNNAVTALPTLAWPNIQHLVLSYNTLGDLTPLAALTPLKSLEINSMGIASIAPLAPLEALETLSMNGNQISDITAVEGMAQLETLSATANRIVDLSPLAGLTRLTSLSLYDNAVTDVQPLAGLVQLNYLYIPYNYVCDFTPVQFIADQNGTLITTPQHSPLTCP